MAETDIKEPDTQEEPTGSDDLKSTVDDLKHVIANRNDETRQIIDDALEAFSKRTPEKPEPDPAPRIQVSSPFDSMGYTRADYEMAMMLFEGTWTMSRPTRAVPSEDFINAYNRHVFEQGDTPIFTNADGDPLKDPRTGKWRTLEPYHPDPTQFGQRAMDTAEAGAGNEFIGQQYVRDLWEAARNEDTLVSDIRTITMTDPTTTIPIDGDLPEMLFVGESTADSATAYGVSDTATGNVTMTAYKFTIQQIWSGEMTEDSIIPWTPFLREKLAMSAALYTGSAMYNGDQTNAATGNINSDDADPTDTKHYLAFDGIRHHWLVDNTGQGIDQGNAALDTTNINQARGLLNGGDDDVDNLIKNINWGLDPRNLRMVMDWDTYMAMLDANVVRTVDQYGPAATVLRGELGSYAGIPIITPSYASKTDTDGKASTTEATNTQGQITIFAPRGWVRGLRRNTQLFFDRIQRTDQFLFELYVRQGFENHGTNVAAGIYNIAV